MSRHSVLLATENGYPFDGGDAGRWGETLTTRMADVNFTVLAVTAHPYVAPARVMPPNVRALITVPLGGMEDPAEYGNHGSFPDYLRRRWSMTNDEVNEYGAQFEQFFRGLTTTSLPPRALGVALLQMHLHLRHYDYHATHTHPEIWRRYVDIVLESWRRAYPEEAAPSAAELIDGWRLVYRTLLPLAVKIPPVDLTHAASASPCALPCIMARLRQRIPCMVSEERVWLRDQYVRGAAISSPFVRWLSVRLMNAVADVVYEYADQMLPAWSSIAQWERARGVDQRRIRVIHPGVEPQPLSPRGNGIGGPVTVCVADLQRVNGQLDLIEAAALVRRELPAARFRVIGCPAEARYAQQCRDLVHGLDLRDTVTFADTALAPVDELQTADVIAFPQVSGSVPHSLLHAMMTGAAILATDVGGMREALGDGGMLVPAGDPVTMAQSLATLLASPGSGRLLGEAARDRALTLLTEDRFVQDYRSAYESFVTTRLHVAEPEAPQTEHPIIVGAA